jgi:hypothetical protein
VNYNQLEINVDNIQKSFGAFQKVEGRAGRKAGIFARKYCFQGIFMLY